MFTTKGRLQLVSESTDVFTTYLPTALDSTIVQASSTSDLELVERDLSSMYSNFVYTYSETGATHVDCETASMDTLVLQCLEKGDWVMIFDTKLEEVGSPSRNPKYLNMYQIMKISRENRNVASAGELFRYQIVLDIGVNARYPKIGSASSNTRIYKFFPPENDPVKYVGSCSLRGTCDQLSFGLCQCFEGFTGDDCSIMNSLTM